MAEFPYSYVSPSQLSNYLKCSKQYELERIAKFPTPPTWYFIGGSAVHKATERLDQESVDSWSTDRMEHLWAQAFGEEIDAAYRAWPEDGQWLKAGRTSRNNKDGQGFRYWTERGRLAVIAWADWRRANRENYVLHSIEEEFLVPLADVQVKGYIDRVFQSGDGYAVVDLKNATKRPGSPLQLAIYRYGWETKNEKPGSVTEAGWFMCKDGQLFPEPLEAFTPVLLRGLADAYLRGVEGDVFLPNIGADCFGCPAKRACAAKSGATPEALQYDSLLAPGNPDQGVLHGEGQPERRSNA